MNATAPTTQDPLARIADLERRLSLAERRLTQVPSVFQSGSRFKTHLWTLIGGKQLGYSELVGATAAAELPEDLPEYDTEARPTTADGVGYIRSYDTREVALLWNGPPGLNFTDLREGQFLCCVDKIKIQITKQKVPDPENPGEEIDDPNEPTRYQTFYLCNFRLS
jgi:hypothetical protein